MRKHLKFRNSIFIPNYINVFNPKNEHLGDIFYYSKWSCYVWVQNKHIIMSLSCLNELTDYMKTLKR